MNNQNVTELAVKIARDVIDNGRVNATADDKEAWLTELEAEVEFEASERGHENSDEIAAAAVEYFA